MLISPPDDQRQSNIQPLTEDSNPTRHFVACLDNLSAVVNRKVRKILIAANNPAPAYEIPINQVLLASVRRICGHRYLFELGDIDSSELFMEMDLLVSNWGDDGGRRVDELAMLMEKMDEISEKDALQRTGWIDWNREERLCWWNVIGDNGGRMREGTRER